MPFDADSDLAGILATSAHSVPGGVGGAKMDEVNEGHRSARQRRAAGPERKELNVIERIVIENFKSLRKVDLSLGRVNLFIGTNANGKSNFLEALRVLEGIGNGFTINEILNGKPKTSASGVWEGIRGGSAHACVADSDDAGEIAIKVYGKWDDMRKLSRPEGWEYYVSFSPDDRGKVTDEYIVEKYIEIQAW